MSKKFLSIIAFSFFIINANAQKIMHSLGAGVNLDVQKVTTTTGIFTPVTTTSTETFFHASGDYMIRYNLTETENSSISLGAPISVGLGTVSEAISDASAVYFSTDISLGAFYNSGLKSTKANESNFGYFVGAGASYGHIGIYYDNATANINTFGPMVYSGIRFAVKNEVASFGLFFRYGVDKSKIKTFGLKFMKDF